eukprot:comp18530_c0_seq1/m.19959 comp18530_c0_seq1/g.19959  ORF comp18530_c0_seq1/g.19959 comp18530_c0_seq1/m.19959 type:complete len:240 (-) comp18530_c0_seq1:537-1256(-)
MVYRVYPDTGSLSVGLADYVAKLSEASIKENGRFAVAVSGGSLPKLLAEGLITEPFVSKVDWSKWHVFFADERFVALDDADSNYLEVKKELLNKVNVGHVYPIKFEGTTDDCAHEYQRQLASLFGHDLPSFDLILLGMGPDGHTCSLFPGHPLLKENTRWVAPIEDSPKPPPKRVTLTFPVVNNSKNVAFVTTGESKADPVENIFNGGNSENYPSGMVQAAGGDEATLWFLDAAAASKL